MSSSTLLSGWGTDSQTFDIFELSLVVLVVAFVLVFGMGVYKNLSIARSIAAKLEETLSEQFVQFGSNGKRLIKDGQSFYWFYATGRRYTSGMSVFMDLAKRMDMFSYTSSFMNNPQRDRLIFYIPILDDVAMDPMSLLIAHKKEWPRLKQIDEGNPLAAAEELAAQVVEVDGIPSEFTIMSEHRDIVNTLLPNRIQELFAAYSKNILFVHVTDQGAGWDPQSSLSQKLIRIECALPMTTSKQSQFLEDMSQLAIHLLDTVAEKKMPVAARKKATEMRQELSKKKEKELQQKRAQEASERRLAKKKEEEEAVKKMSREKQLKYEEKKRKKEYNAKMKKAFRK